MDFISLAAIAFIAVGILIILWIGDTFYRMPFTMKKGNLVSLIIAAAVVGCLIGTYGMTALGWQDWYVYLAAILLLALTILWRIMKMGSGSSSPSNVEGGV